LFDLKKITGFLAGPAGILVILFFFLPWVSVSCNGAGFFGASDETLLQGSGYDLANGFDEDNIEVGLDDFGFNADLGDLQSESGDLSFSEGDFALVEGEESEFDEDPLMYLIPFVGFLALVLASIGFLEPRLLNPITGFIFFILPPIAGLVAMILKYTALVDEIDLANEQALAESTTQGTQGLPAEFSFSAEVFKLNFEIGWWLTILGLVVILAAGIALFLYQERKRPVPLADSVPPPQSPQSPFEDSFLKPQEDTQQLLAQAGDHIRARRFAEARAVLQRLDHPRAREWLAKLDEIDKQK
jgi:hypothetical protein